MGTNEDLTDVIKSAVQARVEASVLEAMSSDGAMKAIVHAALNQTVDTGNYREKKPLLTHLVHTTVREQAKKVVAEEIQGLEDQIRDEVRTALKKSVGVISDSLVSGFVANASGRYPSIEVKFSGSVD